MGLAHTCQRLRALSLPFMHSSVNAQAQHAESLYGLLATYGPIAGLVRQLTFFVSSADSARLLDGILRCCQSLQDLRLNRWSVNPGFVRAIMSQVAQQQHPSVTLSFFQWDTVIHFISSAPRRPQTLRLTETTVQRIMPVLSPPTPTPSPLTEVHTFACNTDRAGSRSVC